MNTQLLEQPSVLEIAQSLATRVRQRRKQRGFSQRELSRRADVSLASLRRFEGTGEISLKSLIKIGVALGYEGDFEQVFARRGYQSIAEVIDEQR
ncbi:MAG: helix-turn-helix transcriptional regulator [Coriobacteriales bacterium]|jgi:transcriptional regulator with XRE-family HTH domain|nr:helix-turn-helix transcriptional regulator [Coriobacteriales bacterium]